MSSEEKSKKGISRRDFFKGSAVAAVGLASGGLLVGCAQEAAAPRASDQAPVVQDGKASFEVAPPPIPDSEIKETVTTDVVVVGAGLAGLCASVAAGQAGAKAVLLEKGSIPGLRGIDYGAIGSKLQKSIGNDIDAMELTQEIMRWGGYKANQKVVELWAKNSGSAVDWLVEMAQEYGVVSTPVPVEDQVAPGATLKTYPTMAFEFQLNEKAMAAAPQGTSPKQAAMLYVLKNAGQKAGVETHFKTPAAQLIKDNNGRVSGVIAQKEDGSYTKFIANKGVILATGDYGNDPEMLAKYIPSSSVMYGNAYPSNLNTGDGHKMGLWVGAAIDEGPHAPMYFDQGIVGWPAGAKPVPVTRQPWLYVNLKGKRFANEDLPYGYNCNAHRQQPGNVKWVIFDSKWPNEAPKFKMTACKAMKPPLHSPEEVEELIAKGVILSGNTLDELVQKMEVPAETFKATVARYNELAKNGKDEDFGKRSECLTTIEKAPFYAVKLTTTLLVTLGGLQVNEKLQVLDTEKNPISGLYAVGNVSGSFYANDYPNIMPGNSHGRALTFGWLAGKTVAEEKA